MTTKTPGTLIPAATILLLRDAGGELEVFTVVRHHQIDFASGALVFPGGKLDPGDKDPRLRGSSRGGEGLEEAGFAIRVAAIREAFEESGVLLASQKGQQGFVTGQQLERLQPWRDRLNRGEAGIADLVQEEGLELALDALVPFAHWITPEMMPKRFDTRFYLAAAPKDHLAVHDGGESVDSAWINPNTAVAQADAGQRTIIFPTRMNLLKLGESATTADALARACARPVVTVMPRVEQRDGQAVLMIPAEAEYAVTEEPLEKAL